MYFLSIFRFIDSVFCQQSTDQTFVQKLVKNCGKSKHLVTSRQSQLSKFTIVHYAGKVMSYCNYMLTENFAVYTFYKKAVARFRDFIEN